MTERPKQRRPATFRLDDPSVVVVDAEDAGRPARGTIQITPEADPAQLPVPVAAPIIERRGFRWGAVFWSGGKDGPEGSILVLPVVVLTLLVLTLLYRRRSLPESPSTAVEAQLS